MRYAAKLKLRIIVAGNRIFHMIQLCVAGCCVFDNIQKHLAPRCITFVTLIILQTTYTSHTSHSPRSSRLAGFYHWHADQKKLLISLFNPLSSSSSLADDSKAVAVRVKGLSVSPPLAPKLGPSSLWNLSRSPRTWWRIVTPPDPRLSLFSQSVTELGQFVFVSGGGQS